MSPPGGCHPHLFYLSDLVSPLFFVIFSFGCHPWKVSPGAVRPQPPSDATDPPKAGDIWKEHEHPTYAPLVPLSNLLSSFSTYEQAEVGLIKPNVLDFACRVQHLLENLRGKKNRLLAVLDTHRRRTRHIISIEHSPIAFWRSQMNATPMWTGTTNWLSIR